MKTTTTLGLALTFLFAGCSADAGARRFVRKQTRAGCRTTKKCNKLAWNDLEDAFVLSSSSHEAKHALSSGSQSYEHS